MSKNETASMRPIIETVADQLKEVATVSISRSSTGPRQQGNTPPVRPPRPEHLHEALDCLLENLPVGDRYLLALVDLIEGEYVRRIRSRRQVA